MQKSILVIWFCFLGASVFAQDGMELKSYFGISSTQVEPREDFVGGGSVRMESFREFRLLVSHGVGSKFRINAV